MAVFGAVVMTSAVLAALALADAPMALVAGLAFGALGLSLAAGRVTARARRRLPVPPVLAVAGTRARALAMLAAGAASVAAERSWRHRPRLPLLPATVRPVAVFVTLSLMVPAAGMEFTGEPEQGAATAAASLVLGAWCIASVMSGERQRAVAVARARLRSAARRPPHPGLTPDEIDALDDWACLSDLLAETDAQARTEGKFR